MLGDACYRKAIEAIKNHRLEDAFDIYVHAFLNRLNTQRIHEREFIAFFRYQLAEYLCNKTNFYIALPEGDMISDLILSKYDDFVLSIEESTFPYTKESRLRLLERLNIIFPCHFNTDAETFFYLESKRH